MNTIFPSTSDQTRWPTALLSLLPFFVAGPLRIILSYQPGWKPGQFSQYYLFFLILSSLVIFGGLILGVVKKFPRWAYPYTIYLAFSLYLLVMYVVYFFHWNINGQYSLFVFLAATLLVLRLPGSRSFYSHIGQDWTLLSYSLYGIVLYILFSVDYDETPRLNLVVLMPSLVALGSALAHLRLRSAFMRLVALLVGTYTGLFFYMIPVFQGMTSTLIGVIIVLLLLMAYGVVLTAFLLSPLLVRGVIHFLRARQTPQ